MKPSERWLYPSAILCLLLSGVAGLVYQVAWARYLALFLGHTSYAVVAVLVAFMGGLALGNAWLGRYADRVPRPLALYGWLEIGIGVYAFVFPWYFEVCQSGYLRLARETGSDGALLLALKFLFSFAAILVPTTLMGGTLPVLTRLVTRSLGELRARLAALYFINSLGAVLGVLIADFWWLPSLGLDFTVYAGAALNLVVGLIALIVNTRLGDDLAPSAAAGPRIGLGPGGARPTSGGLRSPATGGGRAKALPEVRGGAGAEEETYAPFEWRLAVLAAGASGFVAMLYEVVWTRLLALALGSSTHAFSIMLATFIAGIAVGAWWVARWPGLRRTFDAFGWAELALALTLLVSMFFYHYLPYGFARLGHVLVRDAANHGLYQFFQFLVCFAVMFVPALCLGMTLPLASRVATAEVSRTGRSVGLVFSVNTVGTVLGAALTGLVLLPWLGLAKTFALGVGLNLVIALSVLLRGVPTARRFLPAAVPVVLAALVGLVHVTLAKRWERAFAAGLWRLPNPPETLAAYRTYIDTMNVLYHRDGAGSTVVVNTWTNPVSGKVELSLRVNGKADATTRGDLPTQLLLAHLPLLLKPETKDVMVVGLGSGMTCGSVLVHPGVERVDVAEISPEVQEVARTHFAPHNGKALSDPRVTVHLDDAKSFLNTSGRSFDTIISEPSNPWMAGVAGVFSLEFYDVCRQHLTDEGLMVQWVQIYESDDDTFRTVLATFASAFPFFTVWQTLPGDLVLIGSRKPWKPDLAAMHRRFDVPAVTADLRRADVFGLPVLLGLQILSDRNAAFLPTITTVQHSDFFPVLEYQAERAFFARNDTRMFETFNQTYLRRPGTLLEEYLREHPLTATDCQSFALFHTSFRLPQARLIRSVVERWREQAPDSTLAAEFSAKLEVAPPVSELEASRLRPMLATLMSQAEREPELLRIYSRHLMNAYRTLRSAFYQPPTEELVSVLERLEEVDSRYRSSHRLRLAEIAWDRGDDARFFKLATEVFIPESVNAKPSRLDLDYVAAGQVLFLAIETLARNGQQKDAELWCRAAGEGGYLAPGSPYANPWLPVVVRKVAAAAEAAAAAAATKP